MRTINWLDRNRERHRETSRLWSIQNKERISEVGRIYRQNNKEHIRQVAKAYYERTKQAKFVYAKRRQREVRPVLKEKLFNILGGACCCKCGYCKDTRVLQFEHIHDDGYVDRKRFSGSVFTMYRYYIKHPEEARQKLQVMCANCNLEKRYNIFQPLRV